jgi:beta-glucosidase/6-phospho-beta-glucosidase/beta-galactosidase
MFKSFFMGGFESSTHITRAGTRLDMLAASEHDKYAFEDYARLSAQGIYTIRESLRWHLIEKSAGQYDFSSVLPMLRASREAKMQVIWDLCHYGYPDDIDIFGAEFVRRFAKFARAFAAVLANETDETAWIAPINEISFFTWAGGEVGYFNPFAELQGDRLKARLVRATIESIEAVWDVLPDARILHTDPVINVIENSENDREAAEYDRLLQYQAWDMLAGRLHPELGGQEKYLDVVGVNYYPHNQWIYGTPPFNPAAAIGREDNRYKPFSAILREVYQRYRRPLVVSETGAESDARAEWLRYICAQVGAALRDGVPIEGICWYPIVNHPGWDDERHCHNGLWDYADSSGRRECFSPLERELRRQQNYFAALSGEMALDSKIV